jgi:4-amino-4-deoxy-L-arabinose transferase-like glycosyltransferase
MASAARLTDRDLFRPALAVVLAVAFTVRTVYALHSAPALGLFGDDTFFYWTARQLANGHGYVTPLAAFFHKPSLPTAEHPPLYPLMLAALSKIGVSSVDAQRMFNVTVGTGTVLLVALLARRIASERTALLAAFLCAAYPAFIAADGTLMSETLFGALVASAMLQTLRWREVPSLSRAAGVGVLVGLATLTRSEGILLWPLLVVPVLVQARGRRLALIAVSAAGCILVLSPWLIRNAVSLGTPVLSDNEGITVAGANCPETFYGSQIAGFSFDCVASANRSLPTDENETSSSAHARAAGLRYASHHPARAVFVAVARVAAVWGFYAPGRQNVVTGRRVGLQKAGVAIYYLLLTLGAVGAAWLWREGRRGDLLVLIAPFVATAVTAALTYGLVRLRQGAEISLVVLAALGITWIIDARRRRPTPAARRPKEVRSA